jgi:antitoxin ChpS
MIMHNTNKSQPKPKYSLDQLLSQCDPNAPITESDRVWLDIKSVGQEL